MRTDFILELLRLRSFANSSGLRIKEFKVFQNFLAPQVYAGRMNELEKIKFKERQLNLSPEKFTLLLSTGSTGSNNHLEFLKILNKHHQDLQVIVICGRNERAKNNIEKWAVSNPQLELYVEGYSTQVHKLIQASDAIITKGGSNIGAEALYFNCPIIFDCFQSTMPQERLTIRYFSKHNAAKIIRNNRDFGGLISDWSQFSSDYQQTKLNLSKLRSDEDPAQFVKELVDLAKSSGMD